MNQIKHGTILTPPHYSPAKADVLRKRGVAASFLIVPMWRLVYTEESEQKGGLFLSSLAFCILRKSALGCVCVRVPERLEPSDSSTPCRYQADSLLSRMSSCPISHRSWCIEPSWQLRVTRNEGSIPEREPEKWLPQLRLAAGAQIAQSQSPG